MITLLGSLLGFLGAALPDFMKLFTASADRKHEITLLQMQMQQQAQGHTERLEEINANADISESQALHQPQQITGIKWLDGYVGSVRPTITYTFFLLYAFIKIVSIHQLGMNGIISTPWLVWGEEDQCIFAAIISFWFGSRAMQKARDGK